MIVLQFFVEVAFLGLLIMKHIPTTFSLFERVRQRHTDRHTLGTSVVCYRQRPLQKTTTPCVKAEHGIPPEWMSSKEPGHVPAINAWTTAWGHTKGGLVLPQLNMAGFVDSSWEALPSVRSGWGWGKGRGVEGALWLVWKMNLKIEKRNQKQLEMQSCGT